MDRPVPDPIKILNPKNGNSNAASGSQVNSASTKSNSIQVPSINLPKGGGAIKGLDEKFSVNAANGTAALSIPVPFSPGRNSVTPQLSLSYNSGTGNGPYGIGWNCDYPRIQRRTDKKLPEYNDVEDSDTFVLSGAEDLVRNLDQEPNNNIISYRPRIEGVFSRIEKINDNGNIYWRVRTKDNIVSIFGQKDDAKILSPINGDEHKIFSWCLEYTYDDKGNFTKYIYKKENNEGVKDVLFEKNRLNGNSPITNIYLKKILYSNIRPWYYKDSKPIPENKEFLFELVFDYGEHDKLNATTQEVVKWDLRKDPFSDYHSGFELRTYRLCKRLLMFHHFKDELGPDDYLVRSMDFNYDEQLHLTYLEAVSQTSYVWKRDGTLQSKRTLPPLAFSYIKKEISREVKEISKENMVHAPIGPDSQFYQWIDLDSEGISGILTEQATGWYYKENWGDGNFAAARLVGPRPDVDGLTDGTLSIQELEADGKKYLVKTGNALKGFFGLAPNKDWETFTAFQRFPNIDFKDPNLKFLDLNGDGMPDLLLSHEQEYIWYANQGKAGYDDYRLIIKSKDEEKGPIILFSNSDEKIMIATADMSGDGLADILVLTNNSCAYYPNLGYGRFGAKVNMQMSGCFDHEDSFNPRYIHLADIDGSGTSDIVYTGQNKIRVWYNQSGNSLKDPDEFFNPFTKIDNQTKISFVDLLGNGTACLTWSSPIPTHSGPTLRYIDLMNGKKPHLMQQHTNNMGKETTLEYLSSTKFYLKDKREGKKWASSLPFPVQCVSKVIVEDKIAQTRFTTQYTYHHGYYAGEEREFRGFGRVDQIDAETYGRFIEGNSLSPYITDDLTLYQPPVLTRTWFHTGAFAGTDKILSQFQHEYYSPLTDQFKEKPLVEPDVELADLTAVEWIEALRSCKGMKLRQELFELDVEEFQKDNVKAVKLFSTSLHNCHIQILQRRKNNRYAVFLTTESEAITYQYELDLLSENAKPDPRITHTLNLKTDEYGNILETLAVSYKRIQLPFNLITNGNGRIEEHSDAVLPAAFAPYPLPENLLGYLTKAQQEQHIIYTANKYTNDISRAEDSINYRLRLLCETKTYEITGLVPADGEIYYSVNDELITKIESSEEIAYHSSAEEGKVQKRIIQYGKNLFFDDNLTTPLEFGKLNALALPYESYTLVFTDELLKDVYGEKLNTINPEEVLENEGGYHRMNEQWWIRSGIAGFAANAAEHFYVPEKYTDPFGHTTFLKFDEKYDLYIQSSDDALNNHTEVMNFDFRVLAPALVKDINDNLSEVAFDALGAPTAMAIKGKGNEADTFENFDGELNPEQLLQLFTAPFDEATMLLLLGNATSRYIYYLGEEQESNGTVLYNAHPPGAISITREIHSAQLAPTQKSKLQISFQYSDGNGNAIVTKLKAEPENDGGDLRWLANGKTILNNKGKAVKKYEPYFTNTPGFEVALQEGVTPVMYYDAPGRLIRTEMPDGSLSRVDFNPWFSASYDQNDTVLENAENWYNNNLNSPDAEKKRVAELTTVHANTPLLTFLDAQGRDIISLTHNKWKQPDGSIAEEKKFIFTKLDAEGKPLWILDTRGNRVIQCIYPFKADNQSEGDWNGQYFTCYDIAGNLLFQHGMDSGDKWMLNDCTGKPLYAWDSRQQRFSTRYDGLHRPTESRLTRLDTGKEYLVGLEIYGENITDGQPVVAGSLPFDKVKNLRGKVYQHYDQSGRITNTAYDFKGNLLEVNRTVVKEIKNAGGYQTEINWEVADKVTLLEAETFTQITQYDALNRMQQLKLWHNTSLPASIYTPEYNERALLKAEQLYVRGVIKDPADSNYIISGITYNAKGQKQKVVYGNKTITTYSYDEKNFRLLNLRTTGKIVTDENPNEIKILQDLNYTYDPSGNITTVVDAAQQRVFFRGNIVDPVCRYEYDALYRLVHATGREHNGQNPPNNDDTSRMAKAQPNDGTQMGNYSEWYEYDSAGNILKIRHLNSTDTALIWTRQYQYDLFSNRLLGTDGANSATPYYKAGVSDLTEQYGYNAHGSITAMPHLNALDWDFTEHLQHIVKGTQQAWYRYDMENKRCRKTVESKNVKEERIYLGGFEIYRKWNNGELVEQHETTQLVDGAQRMVSIDHITSSENLVADSLLYRYQYSNHLGSAALEIDENNNIISYEEYHPYGTTAYQAINATIRITAKRYRYTGMERDEESGLNYHTARYYMPWLGRWGSTDPIGIDGDINLFAYTPSPINYKDTSGLQACTPQSSNCLRVGHNESLSQFAQRNHVRLSEVVRLNHIKNPDRIREGQMLRLRSESSGTSHRPAQGGPAQAAAQPQVASSAPRPRSPRNLDIVIIFHHTDTVNVHGHPEGPNRYNFGTNERYLTRQGFQVVAATNGREMLADLRSRLQPGDKIRNLVFLAHGNPTALGDNSGRGVGLSTDGTSGSPNQINISQFVEGIPRSQYTDNARISILGCRSRGGVAADGSFVPENADTNFAYRLASALPGVEVVGTNARTNDRGEQIRTASRGFNGGTGRGATEVLPNWRLIRYSSAGVLSSVPAPGSNGGTLDLSRSLLPAR